MGDNVLAKGFPVYAKDEEMLIGGWDSPITSLEDYQMAKDMGLTMMFVDQSYGKLGTKEYTKALEYCEQVGLSAIVSIGNCGETECAKNTLENDDTDYTQYPAVKAINYWDEPFYANFDRVEEMFKTHTAKYGNKIAFFTNHFPNTAIGAFGGLTYEQFLREYSNRILSKCAEGKRYLSADIYPLENKNGENIIRANWLHCIESVALEGKKMNALTHFFLLNTAHHTSEDINYREVMEEDLRYQFFVNMAYGIKAFTYFTYRDSFCKGCQNSCVRNDISCSPHEQYYRAKKVNEEIQAIAPVYLSFKWKGTMPLLGTNNEEGKNENFDGLKQALREIACLHGAVSSEDCLIGQFKDENDNDGLIITNFSDPSQVKENQVQLHFKNADRVRVYNRGQYTDYLVENNVFSINLAPGDGAFLIPMQV